MLIVTDRVCIEADSIAILKVNNRYNVNAHNGRIIQTIKSCEDEQEALKLYRDLTSMIKANYKGECVEIR